MLYNKEKEELQPGPVVSFDDDVFKAFLGLVQQYWFEKKWKPTEKSVKEEINVST